MVNKQTNKQTPPEMQETQETWVRSLSWEDSLEENRELEATHSSIRAWENPRTEEPGRLHGVAKSTHTHTHIHTHTRIYHMNIKKLTGTFLYFGPLSFLNIMPRHKSS